MKRSLRIGALVLALVLIAGGGYLIYRNRTASQAAASSKTYTQVVQVTKGTLDAAVSVVGQLEAEKSASLAFEKMTAADSLLTLGVQAGNTVIQGQVLATIDPAAYQQAVDQARSDLQAAEETLADLQTPATALEIAQADVAVARAQVQLKKAQAALDDLVNPDIATLKLAVANAETALAQAQATVASQGQSQSSKDQLARLVNAETKPTAEYTRLAQETYSDAYYQDRLELAYKAMLDAQDARVSYELNQQASALKAQMALRKAQANLAAAQEALADAQAGGDALAVAQAQLAVHEAEVSLQAAQDARQELDKGTDAAKLAAAQAAVDQKRLALSEAEAAWVGAELVAPFDGAVLETYATVGDRVAANTPILTLADLRTLRVVASIDETTIRQVSAGQTAAITFDAYAGQTFSGQVLAVPLQGSLQGDVMVYSVPISLTGIEDLSLLVGMTANVEIQVGRTAETLLVPTIALTQANGLYQVLTPTTADPNGAPAAVPVEIGLSDGTYTEILKGLNEGDRVLIELSGRTADDTMMPRGMDMGGGGPPAGGAPPSRGGPPPGR